MVLRDFLETDSRSLEVLQTFDSNKEWTGKKTALRTTCQDLKEDYTDDVLEEMIFWMSIYWCSVQNGWSDASSYKHIKKLLPKFKEDYQGEEEEAILPLIDELLEMKPVIVEKPKKKGPPNPGSKNWQPGDVFAYRMTSDEAEKNGIKGSYALLYCYDKKVKNCRANEIQLYMLLHKGDTLEPTLGEIIRNSIFLQGTSDKSYRFFVDDNNSAYPAANLFRYLGNTTSLVFPEDEVIFASKLYYRSFCLKFLESEISENYAYWGKDMTKNAECSDA